MNIQLNGINVRITDGMKDSVEKKLSSLNKFLDENTKISVKVTQKKIEIKLVIMLVYNDRLIKITERDEDFYVAVDKAVDTLKTQIRKQHTLKVKRENDQSETIRTYFEKYESDEEDFPKIVKRKIVALEPMTEEEAINEMEELGHNAFVFLNADYHGIVSMIYRRNDGNYGIVVDDIE